MGLRFRGYATTRPSIEQHRLEVDRETADRHRESLYGREYMKRCPSIALIFLIAVSAGLSAETMAIGVRQITPQEQAGQLIELIEQGAMEAMFQSGHIVFDLDIDPAAEFYSYIAMDQSVRGGAGYTVLLDVAFAVNGVKGLYPQRILLSVFDAENQLAVHTSELDARSVDDFPKIDSLALAEVIGGEAARVVSEALAGGW